MNIVQELEAGAAPGAPGKVLTESKEYKFSFEKVEKKYESYNGINVKLFYLVKVVINRGLMSANISKNKDFWVRINNNLPEMNSNIKMEVGIEDCLHIEFEYNKSKYHLKDVIIGKIYFLLVRLKIKTMNISLLKRETTGTGALSFFFFFPFLSFLF